MAKISGITSTLINSVSGLNVQAITKVSGQLASVFFSAPPPPALLPGRLWGYQDPLSPSPQPFFTEDDACMLWNGGNGEILANPVYFNPANGRVFDGPEGTHQYEPQFASDGFYLFQSGVTPQQFATRWDTSVNAWNGQFVSCAQ